MRRAPRSEPDSGGVSGAPPPRPGQCCGGEGHRVAHRAVPAWGRPQRALGHRRLGRPLAAYPARADPTQRSALLASAGRQGPLRTHSRAQASGPSERSSRWM